MSSPNKITFGNKTVNLNTANTYGFASGQNINSSYGAYQPASGNYVGATTSSYQPYSGTGKIRFGESVGQVNTTNVQQVPVHHQRASNLYVQTGNSNRYTTQVAEVRSPVNTKVTFGNKNYTETYSPAVNYTHASYVAPAVQTYQTYSKPVQITTVTSQPIRQEVRVQTRVEQPHVQVRRSQTKVQSPVVTSPVVTATKPKAKGGCPSWLWPLLGILALLALILGLLFGLGVFRGGQKGASLTTNGTTGTTSTTGTTGTTSGSTSGSTSTTTTESVDYIDPVVIATVPQTSSSTTYTTYPTASTTTTSSSGYTTGVSSDNTYTTYPSNSNLKLNTAQ